MADDYAETPSKSRRSRPDRAPCIINEGTVLNKRDMLRALETLDCVAYTHIVEDQRISSGRAVVAQVFLSRDSATLLVNNCLFINVASFDYLRFSQDGGRTVLSLVEGTSVLELIPNEDGEPKPPSRFARQMFPEDVFDEDTFVLMEEDSAPEDEA
jgi:hypothetical protein